MSVDSYMYLWKIAEILFDFGYSLYVHTVIHPTDIGDNICQANITFSFLGDNGQITLENLTWGRSMGM